MRVLLDQWEDGYLDYWRAPDEYRVRVLAWRVLEELDDLYFVRPRSLRTLWNYGREIRARELVRKVASRLGEEGRNRKVVACGVGRVLEAPEGAEYGVGDYVAFFAPSHPPCCERIVAPAPFVTGWDGRKFVEGDLLYVPSFDGAKFWSEEAGWQRESGVEPTGEVMPRVVALLHETNWRDARRLAASGAEVPCERRAAAAGGRGLSAALFGYGHYARTIVLPNLPKDIGVRVVHELDPVLSRHQEGWDSAPVFREDEHYDVVFLAGYHASHAPQAVEALRRGCHVVVEKPLATTRAQHEALVGVLDAGPSFFAGFHRRYSPMNEWLREDLRLGREPISYHCIVHEVSLPKRHWYRWPSSGSRLLSNGCHWLDHFLFLNDFASVESCDVARGPGGEIDCRVALENGSFFTMVLTDRGSDRVGTREHVEIRTREITATIDDFRSYRSESSSRLIRRQKLPKLGCYERMYREIGRRIVSGLPGDDPVSVARTSDLVLTLEEMLS